MQNAECRMQTVPVRSNGVKAPRLPPRCCNCSSLHSEFRILRYATASSAGTERSFSSCGTACLILATLTSQARPSDLQRADADPVDVELVPGQAVAGAGRVRVVVVVPAFAEGQQRHPPVVGRVVARLEAARAPQVRRRVHQPGGSAGRRWCGRRCPRARRACRRRRAARGRRRRCDTQCQLESQTWNASVLRSGT